MNRRYSSLFALPWLLFTFLLVVVPTLGTFLLAFQGDDGADLSAFTRLLSSDLIGISFFNSLIFIEIPLSIF